MPELSRNEEIENLVEQKGKTLVLILNKADLVSKNHIRTIFNQLKKEHNCFVVSGPKKIGTKRLRDWLIMQNKNNPELKIGVLGYPNTGKSSVINAIVMRKKAAVSARAGTTHGPQWISLKGLRIIDSPGVIPLKQDDEIRYALIGSKNPEKIKNLELVASEILKLFHDNSTINSFYGIQTLSKDINEIIEVIGRKKGFIKKGNEVDENRTAMQIIRDWQTGKLRM